MAASGGARHAAKSLGLAAGLAAAVATTGVSAQYFGGNKVRYEDPDFRVLESEHFDIYTYPEEDQGAADAAVLMERWRRRLADALDHELRGRQPLILYAGHPHFRQTNATPGEIGEGTGGFTEMFKRRIVLPIAGAGAETDHVLGHELVHAFQFDIARQMAEDPAGKARKASATRLPLWFIEGMAEYLSIGSADPHTAMWIRDAVLHKDLPAIKDLNNPKYFPYRYGHAFWAYVGGRYGDAMVAKLLRSAAAVSDIDRAIRVELKISPEDLSKDWQDALRAEFEPAVAAARPLAEHGRPLVKASKKKGRINLAPVLSPDGKRMLFFSERDLFSIELYVLDVESGKVLRSLTRTTTDPHLDSLQFLYTSGTWSPDGKRVALGGVVDGRPVLRIVDAESGEQLEEHRFTGLVELLNPAWSPDGRSIAFAGNKGGMLQLQLFDLESKTLTPLAPGPHADMQPAWSPDSKSIVFVTDRFTSDPVQRTYGDYRLAWLTLATGAVTPVPSLRGGKNINPQWSGDGAYIFFVSDARGAPNLYRLSVANGGIEEMTNLQTGISGITRLSPALSVSTQGPQRIAASIYSKNLYHIYLLENLQAHAVPAATDPSLRTGTLPPRQRVAPKVDRLLAENAPAAEAVVLSEPKKYNPSLSVDYATQISAGVGTSSAGQVVGGGVALYWSDMLGDHNLLTVLQAEGTSDTFSRNLAAVATYENRENRLRWGGAIGQIPSVTVGYTAPTDNGDGTFSQFLIRQWEINREVAARLAYPLSRADRIEGSIGYRHIGYVTDAVEEVYANGSGQFIGSRVIDLPSPPSLEVYPAGVAYVHDTSVFGGTAPAAGTRYRVELGGVTGDLDFYTPVIDYRKYFLPFPYLTLAGRVLHYGRYGRDAEDPRINEIFLGSWTLVRGYDYYSFSASECGGASDCPVFDRLFGSRIAMASAEARVPIFGARGIVPTPSVPPIDIAAFYDTGVAWTSDESPRIIGGTRDGVRSYGATIRMNFFGALVLAWNYAKPIDRPLQDWYWEFVIAPGF